MARQSEYSEEVAAALLERLSAGEPLAQICRDEGMPHPTTFRRWCDAERELDGEPLAIAYARARDDGFDAIAVEALEIADETHHDTKKGANGDEMPNSEWITRSRLRVETRLKLLAKWDPKRYGDLLKLSGADGHGPIPVAQITAEMTPAQAAEAYTKLIG